MGLYYESLQPAGGAVFETGYHYELQGSSDWPQTCDPPASTSQMLGLKVYTTMSGLQFLIENMGANHYNFGLGSAFLDITLKTPTKKDINMTS
jgi:hypothetical protein